MNTKKKKVTAYRCKHHKEVNEQITRPDRGYGLGQGLSRQLLLHHFNYER